MAVWVARELSKSTARLSQGTAHDTSRDRILEIICSRRKEPVAQHLAEVLRQVDHRGSDVRLDSGLVPHIRQDVPYPVFCWKWRSVAAYAWKQVQHINLLEFIAVLNYIRGLVLNTRMHGFRLIHILDRRVAAGVIARGRSSSKRLNRLSRRFMAYELASDLYLLPLWTISGWMPADAGSRLHAPTTPRDDG